MIINVRKGQKTSSSKRRTRLCLFVLARSLLATKGFLAFACGVIFPGCSRGGGGERGCYTVYANRRTTGFMPFFSVMDADADGVLRESISCHFFLLWMRMRVMLCANQFYSSLQRQAISHRRSPPPPMPRPRSQLLVVSCLARSLTRHLGLTLSSYVDYDDVTTLIVSVSDPGAIFCVSRTSATLTICTACFSSCVCVCVYLLNCT